MAAYVDETGRWQDLDFQQPQYYGGRWQQLDWEMRLNVDGELVHLDLMESLPLETVIGIIYKVIDHNGDLVYQVGDFPGIDEDNRITLPGESGLYYRIKLLKGDAMDQHIHPFYLVLRNIYDIGARSISVEDLDLKIEWNTSGANLDVDEVGIPYIRIFGLDSQQLDGSSGSDGRPDVHDPILFDLNRGLLIFPLSFPHPFAANSGTYELYADSSLFIWSGSYLQLHQTPQIYDPLTYPGDYQQYSPFLLKFFIKQE